MKKRVDPAVLLFAILGLGLVLWLALLLAPYLSSGFVPLLQNIGQIFQNPFHLTLTTESAKYALLFSALYLLIVFALYSSKQGYRKGEEYGSARFGNAKALCKKYEDRTPENNLILTRHFQIGLDGYRHQRNINILVVGGSGAGKSRSYAMPNLLQANASYIALDPSGELLASTGSFLKAQCYKIRVLNLYEPENSDGYNPFMYIHSDDDVLRLVTNLWKATEEKGAQKGEQFWDGSAREFLQAIVFFLHYRAFPNEQNFDTVLFMIREAVVEESEDEEILNPIDRLFEELEETDSEHIAVKYYRSYKTGSGKTLKSIQKVLTTRLERFNLGSIVKMTSVIQDELNLYQISKEKTAIFCVTPVADKSFNFIVSLLYLQLFEILYNQGNEAGGRLGIPVHFLMDEFSNVSVPDDFEMRLATMRKYGIFCSIILQNISQLKELFPKAWESIIGLCDEFLFLGGNEKESHKYVSELMGKQTILLNTYGESKGRSGSYSKNTQQTGRALMTPDEVRQMDNKKALLFVRGEYPILDDKFDLMRHTNIRQTPHKGGRPYVYKN